MSDLCNHSGTESVDVVLRTRTCPIGPKKRGISVKWTRWTGLILLAILLIYETQVTHLVPRTGLTWYVVSTEGPSSFKETWF